MGFIVWVIIILCIVWAEVKKQKKRNQGTRPNVPRNPQMNYGRPQQTVSGQVPGNAGQRANAQHPVQGQQTPQQAYRAAQPNYRRPQQSRPNGQRPAQGQQGSQQRANGQRPVQGQQRPQNVQQSNDILSRATANVQENAGDLLKMQVTGADMMPDAQVFVNVIDIGGASELMREVNDLMITGYRAEMTFERDFVAEGVEMLNRCELLAEA